MVRRIASLTFELLQSVPRRFAADSSLQRSLCQATLTISTYLLPKVRIHTSNSTRWCMAQTSCKSAPREVATGLVVREQPRGKIQQIKSLRPYGKETYLIASPYPGQDAPVIATSWRVQLELNSAEDPRLRRFVDQFRITELAPLSGNRCTLGVGKPRG